MFCEQCGTQIGDGERFCPKCVNSQVKEQNNILTLITSKNGFPIFLIVFGIVLFLLGFIGMRIRLYGLIIGILALIVGIVIFLLQQKVYNKIAVILTITGSLMLISNPRFGIIAPFAGYFLILGSVGLFIFGLIKLLILKLKKSN